MKKLLSILLVCLVTPLIVSCGSDDDEPESPNPETNGLTSSDYTSDGYFDGILYYQIISNVENVVEISKCVESAKEVNIPRSIIINGVKYNINQIGDHAFSGCKNLLSVIIGDNIQTIGKNAFENCSSLKSVEIPNSITNVDDYAFQNCTSLNFVTSKITNPVNVGLGANAFTINRTTKIDTLFIPQNTLDLYLSGTWSNFFRTITDGEATYTKPVQTFKGDWYGDFGMYYSYSDRYGHYYEVDATQTNIRFYRDGADYGHGEQIDFYDNGPYRYQSHYFNWRMVDDVIQMRFSYDQSLDCNIYRWSVDYEYDPYTRQYSDVFSGYINNKTRFSLYKLNDYDGWGKYGENGYGFEYYDNYTDYFDGTN